MSLVMDHSIAFSIYNSICQNGMSLFISLDIFKWGMKEYLSYISHYFKITLTIFLLCKWSLCRDSAWVYDDITSFRYVTEPEVGRSEGHEEQLWARKTRLRFRGREQGWEWGWRSQSRGEREEARDESKPWYMWSAAWAEILPSAFSYCALGNEKKKINEGEKKASKPLKLYFIIKKSFGKQKGYRNESRCGRAEVTVQHM